MTKSIKTLVKDIQDVLVHPHEFSADAVEKFSHQLARTIVDRINPPEHKRTLRLSNLGKPDRQLWYEINSKQPKEELPFEARMKFLFGDILEELLLFLAEEAGHEVSGRQDVLDLEGIKGHRDAVIDGVLVDVKSASPFSYKKFKEGLKPEDDAFGYLTQLNNYHQASKDVDPDKMGFLVIDKTLGHVHLDMHKPQKEDYRVLAKYKKEMVKGPIPDRCYPDEPEGASGNRKLSTPCSYCPFKQECWPGLRTFVYSKGPVFLTKVVKEPNVPEA